MTKRVRPTRTEENSGRFVPGTELLSFVTGPFDAIAMVAAGEQVIGKIHKFYVVEVQQQYKQNVRLMFKDIPAAIGAFIRKPDSLDNLENLKIEALCQAELLTVAGDLVRVQSELFVSGYTETATGETVVVFKPGVITAVIDDEGLNTDHPFLDVYRRQTAAELIVPEQCGFILEATADVES